METAQAILSIILQLLPYLVGGGGLVALVIYRRQNRQLKDNEVKLKEAETKLAEAQAAQSDINTQSQKIDLGDKFINEMLDMSNLLKKNNTDTETIVKEVSDIRGQVATLTKQQQTANREMAMVKRYLNGQYKEFVEAEKAKRKK